MRGTVFGTDDRNPLQISANAGFTVDPVAVQQPGDLLLASTTSGRGEQFSWSSAEDLGTVTVNDVADYWGTVYSPG